MDIQTSLVPIERRTITFRVVPMYCPHCGSFVIASKVLCTGHCDESRTIGIPVRYVEVTLGAPHYTEVS